MVGYVCSVILYLYVIFLLPLGTSLPHSQKVAISHSTLTVIWQSMAVVRMMLIVIFDNYAVTADHQQYAETGQASSQMTAHTGLRKCNEARIAPVSCYKCFVYLLVAYMCTRC